MFDITINLSGIFKGCFYFLRNSKIDDLDTLRETIKNESKK